MSQPKKHQIPEVGKWVSIEDYNRLEHQLQIEKSQRQFWEFRSKRWMGSTHDLIKAGNRLYNMVLEICLNDFMNQPGVPELYGIDDTLRHWKKTNTPNLQPSKKDIEA
jgi:hypothetical protein